METVYTMLTCLIVIRLVTFAFAINERIQRRKSTKLILDRLNVIR